MGYYEYSQESKEVAKSVASYFFTNKTVYETSFGLRRCVLMVKVNGNLQDVAGKTIEVFISETGYDKTRIAVEINGDIVPKARYSEVVFDDGDSVEVVSFVGGG